MTKLDKITGGDYPVDVLKDYLIKLPVDDRRMVIDALPGKVLKNCLSADSPEKMLKMFSHKLDVVMDEFGEDVFTIYELGRIAFANGDIALAEEYYQFAVDRGNVDAMCDLARLEFEIGNVDKAREIYGLAIELDDVFAMNNLAVLENKVGNTQRAIELFSLAAEKGDKYAEYNLAVMKNDIGFFSTDAIEKIADLPLEAKEQLLSLHEDDRKKAVDFLEKVNLKD